MTASPQKHTSIIYFHGMGTPKRFQELTRVLDTLDRHATDQKDEVRQGVITDRPLGIEPSRCEGEDPVAFIRFDRCTRDNPSDDFTVAGRFRLYESYWSPAAAGADNWLTVLLWVLARVLTPFQVLGQPWRAHQRLKRTFLNRMFHDRGRMPARRYADLEETYGLFDGLTARRMHPSGRFGRFLKFIAQINERDPKARVDLEWLAGNWFAALFRSQMSVILTALNVGALLIGTSAMAAYLFVVTARFLGFNGGWLDSLAKQDGGLPTWVNVVAICGFVLGAWFFTRFLRLFLSDVVFWTTTFEKDMRYRKRMDILRAAENTVAHVMRDPNCERIVIVAHSLGTAIAYETLLNLGRKQSAERDGAAAGPGNWEFLRKISHLITFGSPIDRINYFFQLSASRSFRFNHFSDDLLGHCSDLPFHDEDRRISWINVRDPADPVASRLFSPRGPIPNRDHIQEIESTSSHFPDPAGAHTRYFDTRLTGRLLFDTCVLGRVKPQLQLERPNWSRRTARTLRSITPVLGTAFCLALAVGGVAYWSGSEALLLRTQIAIMGLSLLFGVLFLVGQLADRKHRLVLPT